MLVLQHNNEGREIMHTIQIPGSWDGFNAIEDQAYGEEKWDYIALQAAIENGSWRKQGRGRILTIKVTTSAVLQALAEEAKYQDEYWNTDLYGIKEAGSSSSTSGRAARVVRKRVNDLLDDNDSAE